VAESKTVTRLSLVSLAETPNTYRWLWIRGWSEP